MKLALIFVLLLQLTFVGYSTLFADSVPVAEAQSAAASPTPAVSDAITRPVSEVYTGSLDIFEDPDRDKKLQVDRVMDVLGIGEGDGVADIGAGSGWFTVRAARRVGAKGKVYAVEINQEYIKYIDERAKKESLPQIQTVLGKADDPSLPAGAVDAVLILKTYHEIGEPVKLMKALSKSMRKGGLVGIIDKNGNGSDHGLGRDTVIEEMGRAGFKLKEEFDFVKGDGMDYLLVFETGGLPANNANVRK